MITYLTKLLDIDLGIIPVFGYFSTEYYWIPSIVVFLLVWLIKSYLIAVIFNINERAKLLYKVLIINAISAMVLTWMLYSQLFNFLLLGKSTIYMMLFFLVINIMMELPLYYLIFKKGFFVGKRLFIAVIKASVTACAVILFLEATVLKRFFSCDRFLDKILVEKYNSQGPMRNFCGSLLCRGSLYGLGLAGIYSFDSSHKTHGVLTNSVLSRFKYLDEWDIQGGTIAYSSLVTNQSQIVVADLKDLKTKYIFDTMLYHSTGDDYFPICSFKLSPDERKLAIKYMHPKYAHDSELYIINV